LQLALIFEVIAKLQFPVGQVRLSTPETGAKMEVVVLPSASVASLGKAAPGVLQLAYLLPIFHNRDTRDVRDISDTEFYLFSILKR
jgi:hypothetical protein